MVMKHSILVLGGKFDRNNLSTNKTDDLDDSFMMDADISNTSKSEAPILI